jgi:hypothetical protein
MGFGLPPVIVGTLTQRSWGQPLSNFLAGLIYGTKMAGNQRGYEEKGVGGEFQESGSFLATPPASGV